MKNLVILVGASGSGKSSWSRGRADATSAVVCSADDGLIGPDGVYRFDKTLLGAAHRACFLKAQAAMRAGAPLVVIDNTSTILEEIGRYLTLGHEHSRFVEVLVVCGEQDPEALALRNKHGVPVEVIRGQLDRISKTLASWPAHWPAYQPMRSTL